MRKLLVLLSLLVIVVLLVGCQRSLDQTTPSDTGDKVVVETENDALAEDMTSIADSLDFEDLEDLEGSLAEINDLELE